MQLTYNRHISQQAIWSSSQQPRTQIQLKRPSTQGGSSMARNSNGNANSLNRMSSNIVASKLSTRDQHRIEAWNKIGEANTANAGQGKDLIGSPSHGAIHSSDLRTQAHQSSKPPIFASRKPNSNQVQQARPFTAANQAWGGAHYSSQSNQEEGTASNIANLVNATKKLKYMLGLEQIRQSQEEYYGMADEAQQRPLASSKSKERFFQRMGNKPFKIIISNGPSIEQAVYPEQALNAPNIEQDQKIGYVKQQL
ncbi:hypothetical protein FGO68_gene7896 [Halteria grandinella]|uniref:Uncharacterized protein n=1 Tax=Halteria grandinella TaxID=5974 RepID=A0A8J8SUD0_HALGN|nr:hypothetical protein FGO68_gene7896 [Halteria grandinella]